MKRFAFIAVIAVLAPVCFLILLSRVAVAAECSPSAILEGDPATLLPIREILSLRGVSTEPEKNCPSVRARVERRDQVLVVRVTDFHGRESERTVDDAAAAATLIESWVRSDIGLSLVTPPELETPEPPAPPAEKTETPAPPAAKRVVTLFAAGEAAWGNENSLWAGAAVGGCGHWGPTCVGGLFRYGSNLLSLENRDEYDLVRYAMDGMATVDFPLSAKVVYFSPGIGFGAGWIHSEGMAQGIDPAIDERLETFDTWGPVAQVHLAFGREFGSGFNMALAAACKIYAPSHTDAFRRDDRELPGEPWFMGTAMILMMFGL